MVERNQDKISTLVMDMLTFSKDREPDPVPSDLNQVVGDVVELMQSRADGAESGRRVAAGRDMPTLTFDPEGIHRAVLNMVTNALDACDGKPQTARSTITTEYRRPNRPGADHGRRQRRAAFRRKTSTRSSRSSSRTRAAAAPAWACR